MLKSQTFARFGVSFYEILDTDIFFQFFYLFTNNIKDQGENYIGENCFFGVGGIFFSMPLSAYLCVVK